MSDYILQSRNLTKKYGKHTANDNISMHIPKGSIYGLVGRNGAGKTTFMKMICGLANPTSGTYEIFGDTYPRTLASRPNIGNLIEMPGIYPSLSAMGNLRAKALLTGETDKKKLGSILEIVGLSRVGSKNAAKFSLGMLQRLGIAIALVGNPDLLVLDEPINGLDPTGVADIRETLRRLNEERGITILISSHILGELSKLATHYGFIEKGSLVREVSHEQLTEECTEYVKLTVDRQKEACDLLNGIGIREIEWMQNGSLRLHGCMDRIPEIAETLVKGSVGIYEIAKQGIDLEAYYLNLINGKEA